MAGSLEEGVKIVAERGSGALTLSQEIVGRVVDMIIHFSVSDLLNDHREPTTESVFRITLNVSCPRFVRNSEEALLKFLETTVRLIRDIDPLVVFAGIEYEIPNVTETELETAPIRISPCTYFGPTACDYLGRDKLLSAPAKLVKTIGDGILLVACPRYFGGCILTECDPIAEHLDLESAR
ncbi:hypothetical protein [Haloferax sp. DFSO60]|uniref:hypothetical protein n=1 Tax=Haloferax sp. DFSO60 TaxID=3388652 RepID=UPI00397D4A51